VSARQKSFEKHVVARVQDVPPGGRLIVDVGGLSVGLFNVDGTFYAVLNRCPHAGAELCKGEVVSVLTSTAPGDWQLDTSRKLLACPWHGWEYDLETGESWVNPENHRVRPYAVEVAAGESVAQQLATGQVGTSTATVVDPVTHRVKGPFTAEVLPIAVEDDYLVISLRGVATPR
jgi:3-phenylpropionate/trans-cinnamate dioxygenase ferredoxin subunit